ncbi:glycerophosphoryl diester phosphodiesterase [Neptunomonas antarctica]|uniref:Glycerophosphoryl diester phosphodiesterase n=1 Tax=Neptunomonas antarctica TaxID=619304 RepID=A0A1N7NQ18_9GAMM|nr:glycerophosphoryl diester phosphodiesterase [Neptunomonas antarctica]SIT00485.1 glycerophosphoryl diester phosphodiesterase [Neptunomonas antarctica]
MTNKKIDMGKTIQASAIIGHRGLSALSPENTLAAIKVAHLHKIDWIEVDASILGDGTIVLCHDDTLNRCSDRQGSLLSINQQDLLTIDAGSWFSDTFKGEPIPTLIEAFVLLSELNIGLNLELKAQQGVTPHTTVNLIYPLIKNHWKSNKPLLISSFDHEILRLYRQRDPQQLLGPLYEIIEENWHTTMQELGAVSLHCDWQHLTLPLAIAIKTAGYQLFIYTCNDPDIAKKLWHMGVDSIISDVPHLLSPR